MKDRQPTLLIMAAGMGSRYGGLKQMDPVGPSGEQIIDYSLYDAVSAGFTQVVFVIRHSFEQDFRARMGHKLDGRAQTSYAFQELDSCLEGRPVPAGREKPWGTAHAVLVASELVDSSFAVINADDYYGPMAYRKAVEAFGTMASGDGSEQAMIGYELRNTLSEHGGVSRGVCQRDSRGYLTRVTEMHGIRAQGQGVITAEEGGVSRSLAADQIVSMNFWAFHPRIFDPLRRHFRQFMESEADSRKELYLPAVVDRLITEGEIRVKVFPTPDRWFGVTYKQDRDLVAARIRELVAKGVYPPRLWEL
jgi:NDP-sugar pyrophosphorylase family protein